jgi:hypothetical protein
MADDVIGLVTATLKQITDGQREMVALLREMKGAIRDLSERLDLLEERQSPPLHPELPE